MKHGVKSVLDISLGIVPDTYIVNNAIDVFVINVKLVEVSGVMKIDKML